MNNDRIHKNKHDLNKGISLLYNVKTMTTQKNFYFIAFGLVFLNKNFVANFLKIRP